MNLFFNFVSADGALWACSPDSFYLREYQATIAQEDGSDKEETVNEATSILAFMKGQSPAHGIRLNGGKKQQVIRNFKDEETGQQCLYGKFAMGGSCIVNAGRCIIIATFNETKGHTSAGCNDVVHIISRFLFKSVWPEGDEGSGGAESVSGVGGAASWQVHVDTMLIGKGNVAQALVLNKEDGSMWASSPGFEASWCCNQIKEIM